MFFSMRRKWVFFLKECGSLSWVQRDILSPMSNMLGEGVDAILIAVDANSGRRDRRRALEIEGLKDSTVLNKAACLDKVLLLPAMGLHGMLIWTRRKTRMRMMSMKTGRIK